MVPRYVVSLTNLILGVVDFLGEGREKGTNESEDETKDEGGNKPIDSEAGNKVRSQEDNEGVDDENE